MGGLFSKPKVQQAPAVEVPKTPTVDQDLLDRQTADRLSKRRGRAATMLATEAGGSTSGSVGTKTALGG